MTEREKTKKSPETNYSATVSTGSAIYGTIDVFSSLETMLTSNATIGSPQYIFIEPILAEIKRVKQNVEMEKQKLLSEMKTDLNSYKVKIEEYRQLVVKRAEEPEFQKFFQENPVFLEPHFTKVFPKKSLGGEGFPDFILLLKDGSYVIVEIEKPALKLYNKQGDPKSELTHAEEQIRGYLRWAIEEKEYLRKRGLENLTAENTTGLVVIGAGLTKSEKLKLDAHNDMVRGKYKIKTFDRVLEENESILGNLKK